MKSPYDTGGIPVSPLLTGMADKPGVPENNLSKRRLLRVCALSVIVAAAISVIAKILVMLINAVTNLSFYGSVDTNFHSPAGNHLGLWVIVVPAAGGVLVGVMALYGSKAIRGHGIPEAMEQILTNQSKIKPSITLLKPISSAIAIGTGGPFGAEGPIIATGGALGSTIGQLFSITPNERKVILAAGATAGMSAIFGTPIAAIFLAIELLLFEFSPRSILPVALACITGAAGHHLLFEAGPVFPMHDVATPSNGALAIYSGMGAVIGLLSLLVTKAVYVIEDAFEKLPVHWMWWPAIGGLAVGVTGYFAPYTLGVGYDNIISILSGSVAAIIVLRLFFFKFLSWAIALGSGTSGGTLAPLLTIGGAGGAFLGIMISYVYPGAGISIPMCALIGMSAMFAGASRAYLTSIIFALEATGQFHALLPLLGACTAAFLISFFLAENTIMTEKIARRNVHTPDSFEPDILGKLSVGDVADMGGLNLYAGMTIAETRKMLKIKNDTASNFIITDRRGEYIGIAERAVIESYDADPGLVLKDIAQHVAPILKSTDSLRRAVELMTVTGPGGAAVMSEDNTTGIINYKHIVDAYQFHRDENDTAVRHIVIKRRR